MGIEMVAVAMALSGAASSATEPGLAPGQWTAERAREWYDRQPWLIGFNFVPSTACNDIEIWQADTFDEPTIDRELGWAGDVGFNTCRVFLSFAVWQHDPEGLKQRFDRFLSIAARHGIRVMPVPLDDCNFTNQEPAVGKQPEPTPGLSNACWVPSPSASMVRDPGTWAPLEAYIKDMVGTYARDTRIVMWDLYNEPGNSGLGNDSLPLVEAAFRWAREVRPTQPLTVGVWGGPPEISQRQIGLSDIVSFHLYGPHAAMKDAIARYRGAGRPVVCTEWMARTLGARWETDLPLLYAERVGCYSWGLVNGRTQTQFPWGSPAGAPEPDVWFHDLLHRDGTPYDPREIQVISRMAGRISGAFALDGEYVDLPNVTPLFDYPVRDTSVCLGPDGMYYLTGTTGHPTWWQTNEGIRVWRSPDLKTFEPLGLVWSFEKDATWQQPVVEGRRAIWAPEIHYLKGTFWLTYCVNWPGGGTGVLRSTTGKAGGPYIDIKPDGPLTNEIDASLFEDDDGSVYFVYQNGKIARMRNDMSGLAEEPRVLAPSNAPQVGFEGAALFKIGGRYYLIASDFIGEPAQYHCMAASSDSIYGPCGPRYLAVPHGGHNVLFADKDGAWWSTFFGNDPLAPFHERPAILRIHIDEAGRIRP